MIYSTQLQDEFLRFLLKAKKYTYASQGDAATVPALLPASKQLEWSEGEWLYRDIYFGMAYFVGQEIISFQQRPLWSMSYAGGITTTMASDEAVRRIYGFLRSAMRQVTREHPYRGPERWQVGDYLYTDKHWGEITAFWGHEEITFQEQPVYELHYGGGFLK